VCQKFGINPVIEINFRRMSKDTNFGYCCHLEDNEFEIDIKRTLRLRDMLTTLAHELVHVKQYVKKEMPDDITQGDYWDRPHEIEAHGRELGLFIQWAEHSKLGHHKWTRTE
jgi:glycosylphosphatidylinositol transamidase (GPIT) subunit GPI8